MWWQAAGVIENVWSDPHGTVSVAGEMLPPAPAEAVMRVLSAKLAETTWFAVTLVNV